MSAVKKVKPVFFIFCTTGVLLLLLIGFFSFGWFMNSKTTSGDKAALKATDTDFELGAVDSSGVFDEYLTAEDGTVLSDVRTENFLESLFDRITPSATGGGKNEIKWQMSSKSNFNNYSGENAEQGIQPGSSGKLSFYVIAKRDTALNITFSLDKIIYNTEAMPIDGSNPDNMECIISEDQPEAGLVEGHILFFKNYGDGKKQYSNRITDGRFVFSEPAAKAGIAYKVDIYWIWPDVVDQIILPENDLCFVSKGHEKIISDADTAAFKAELISSPEKFFADTAFDVSGIVENVSQGTASSGFNSEYYNMLNAKWNEADQLIGKKVGFIELQISNIDP